MSEVLIELFSEEIPARMQATALADFVRLITDGMADAGLSYGSKKGFVTPRRLVLIISEVPKQSLAQTEDRKGPRVDAPAAAIDGFLRGAGMTKDQLEIRDVKGVPTYFAKKTTPGRDAKAIVAEVLDKTIRNFPWPKSMRWGTGDLRWVRPLHSIIAIFADETQSEIIELELDGIRSGRTTIGHRFLAPQEISIQNSEDFLDKLAKAFVVLDPEVRAERIKNDAKTAAFVHGLELVEDEKLLAENAGLVEFPVIYLGKIETPFLDLPPEVIQTSMAEHQKFLSLKDKNGQITGYVIVANRTTSDQGETIKTGNAKVLRARLSDAVFFWENDKRKVAREGVDFWLSKLQNVTFHNKLGTQGARIDRISKLASELASKLGADENEAAHAAQIAKADLASEMVYEFPELQGVMGRYYAIAMGEKPATAAVCTEHYAPLGPSDAVPSQPLSVAVALADKIDMLTGFWAIDERPTGSKDPFALRRAALGVIRIILENDLRFSLVQVLGMGYPGADIDHLMSFIFDRLSVYLREEGISHDVINALRTEKGADDLAFLVKRIRALDQFLKTENGINMRAGIKRALNILAKEEAKDGVFYELPAEEKLMSDPAELALYLALTETENKMAVAINGEDFPKAMAFLGEARPAVDHFFEKVTVNAENAIMRRNRLCLLNHIRVLSQRICNFTELEG